MGRKSALSEKQWKDIEKRLLGGESGRSLAAEYKVSEAGIRKKFGARTKAIKDVIHQVVAADSAMLELKKNFGVGAQIDARTMADELLDITASLASAAACGARTAYRTAAIANAQAERLDEAACLDDNMETLKSINAFTAVSNESAKIGLSLISAKEIALAAKSQKEKDITPKSVPNDPIEASIAYQRMLGGKA